MIAGRAIIGAVLANRFADSSMKLAFAIAIAVAVIAPPVGAQHDAHTHSTAPKAASKPAPRAASKATPYGRPGDPAKAERTVSITMSDTMRFAPSSLEVRRGETVRLVVANDGKLLHELVLGTRDGLRKHAEAMRKNPQSAHHDDDVTAVHVQPAAKGEIVWTFDRAGTFAFACLVPGHFEAGMTGSVVVK